MGPQLTRALVMVVLFAACAAKYPHGGFAVRPEEADAERGCQQGEPSACGVLGRMLIAAGTDQNFERGIVLLEIACGQDDAPACTTLTRVYMRGSNDKQSLARAHDLATRGCERGAAVACTQLGDVIQLERGDHSAQAAAYLRGCDSRRRREL